MAHTDSGSSSANSSVGNPPRSLAASTASAIPRISSRELLGSIREIEIDHEGRIYKLRLTHSNKLILTA